MKAKFLRALLRLILRLHNASYRWAGALGIRSEGMHPKHRLMRYKEWFLDRVAADEVVLDVGSNTGAMPRLLAQKASFVYGVEIDKSLVTAARKANAVGNVEYIHADATRLDYSQLRPISVITLSNVLEHIENRVDFLADLVQRVKWRSGAIGRFLIRVPMVDRDWITLYKGELGVEWRLDPTHFIEYTMDALKHEIGLAGLSIEECEVRFGEAYLVCRVSSGMPTNKSLRDQERVSGDVFSSSERQNFSAIASYVKSVNADIVGWRITEMACPWSRLTVCHF